MTDRYDEHEPSDDPDWDAWLDALADWITTNPDEPTEEEAA